jgi:putative thioredoxin
MNTADHIIEVSEADFEYQVIAYSQQTPVVVDFWAEWCGPCRMLGPMLERMTREANGAFRLAKVNVDENPSLARRYNIRSIPAVKAFRDGQVVAEFMGAQPEPRVREFIRQLAPGEFDLALGKAQNLLGKMDWPAAEAAFRQVYEENPDQPAARLGLIKSLLFQGKAGEARELMRGFPDSKELAAAEKMRPLVEVLDWVKQNGGFSEDPLEAAYMNALRLVKRGNLPAAMDGILDILRQDKRYRNGETRQVMLALFEMLGDENPLTREYRNELSMVLF